jgi:uncharacterized DUF497 family protein
MHIEFEWDPAKASTNLKKHGVAFAEAATVFRDALSFTWFDPHHSGGEERYLTLGLSQLERVIVVAHTERGERIRIISARKATRRETEFYEQNR